MTFADFVGYYKLARSEGPGAAVPVRRLPRRPSDDPG